MGPSSTSRFESIEEAHEYVKLLREVVDETRELILADMAEAAEETSGRRHEALRLVDYRLQQLRQHLSASSLILNDLRTLRRALYAERQREAATTHSTR